MGKNEKDLKQLAEVLRRRIREAEEHAAMLKSQLEKVEKKLNHLNDPVKAKGEQPRHWTDSQQRKEKR